MTIRIKSSIGFFIKTVLVETERRLPEPLREYYVNDVRLVKILNLKGW